MLRLRTAGPNGPRSRQDLLGSDFEFSASSPEQRDEPPTLSPAQRGGPWANEVRDLSAWVCG